MYWFIKITPQKQKKPHNVSTPNQIIHYTNFLIPPFTSQKKNLFSWLQRENEKKKKLVVQFFSSPSLHIKTILKLTFKS